MLSQSHCAHLSPVNITLKQLHAAIFNALAGALCLVPNSPLTVSYQLVDVYLSHSLLHSHPNKSQN